MRVGFTPNLLLVLCIDNCLASLSQFLYFHSFCLKRSEKNKKERTKGFLMLTCCTVNNVRGKAFPFLSALRLSFPSLLRLPPHSLLPFPFPPHQSHALNHALQTKFCDSSSKLYTKQSYPWQLGSSSSHYCHWPLMGSGDILDVETDHRKTKPPHLGLGGICCCLT